MRTAIYDKHADEFATEYQAGDSIRTIAARHNVSFGTVHRYLIAAGVKLRGRGGPNRKKPALSEVLAQA